MSVDDAFENAVNFFDFEGNRAAARQQKVEANRQAVALLELGAQERQLVREEAQELKSQQVAAAGASGAEGGSFQAAQLLSIQRSIQEEERILKGRLDVAQAILRRGRRAQKAGKRAAFTQLGIGIAGLVTGGALAGVGGAGAVTLGLGATLGSGADEPPQPGLLS